jgi:hypothetical protein
VKDRVDSDTFTPGSEGNGFERCGLTSVFVRPIRPAGAHDVICISCSRSTSDSNRSVPVPPLGSYDAKQVGSTTTARRRVVGISTEYANSPDVLER